MLSTSYEDEGTPMTISRRNPPTMRNFSGKIVENVKTYFVFDKVFFPKIVPILDNVQDNGRSIDATDGNTIRRTRFSSWITKSIALLTYSMTQSPS